MLWQTRNILWATALFTVAAAAIAHPAASEIRFVWAFENPGTLDYALINAMAPHLTDRLGDRVVIEVISGEPGPGSQFTPLTEHLIAAEPDGATLAVIPLLPAELGATLGTMPPHFYEFTPVVKLIGGASYVLAVAESSPIEDFEDFAAAAKEGPLRLGYQQSGVIAEAFLVRHLETTFRPPLRRMPAETAEAVLAGQADAVIFMTSHFETLPASRSLRPIVTFGAERSELLNRTVPTFSEITGDDKDDFTTSWAVFGPPGMSEATLERLHDAFAYAGSKPDVQAVVTAAGLTLEVHGPDVVVETMKRDESVIERLRPQLQK